MEGLQARETKISGLDRRSGPAQSAMEAADDLVGLRPVGGDQDACESFSRSNLAKSSSCRAKACPHEFRRAQRDADLVASQADAARGQTKGSGQRPIHA